MHRFGRAALGALISVVLIGSLTLGASAQDRTPVIERIEPTSGPPGTTVEMVGRYFRRDQEVLLRGTAVEVVTRLPNRWSFRIPAGATSGPIEIRVPGGSAPVIGPQFRVLAAAPPPVITDIQPRSAAPGTEVRIIGDSFSPRLTENQVTLAGQPVVVRSATPTELRVIVPTGASSGTFTVRVTGAGEVTSELTLAIGVGVSITELAPAIGPPGSRVTIRGTGFSTRSASDRVFLGRRPCRVISATETELVVEIPARGASSATILVDVRGEGRAFSSQTFQIQEMPVVRDVVPPAGAPGAEVHVRGRHFGTDVRAIQVTVGGAAGVVRALTDTDITLQIPEGATSGPIEVTVNTVGPAASPEPFRALTPVVLAGFTPQSGGPGTEVVVRGSGFSATAADNRVSISGARCEIVSATGTELHVRIPAAASGPLVVEVEHAGSATTSRPFVVTNPPFVARFEPERGLVGSTVTIHGQSFGTNAALVQVTFAGRPATISSVTDTRLEVVVPDGARTGHISVAVRLQGSTTTEREFTVQSTFAVRSVAPTSAYPGQSLVIRGEGFTASEMQVRFTGSRAAASHEFVSSSELRVVVPEDAADGPITVRSADEREGTLAFTRAPDPEGVGIAALAPVCLRPRCRVVVRGWGFAPRASGNRVTIGTSRGRVRRASAHELEIELPRTPGTMTIRVQVGEASAESEPITIAE